MSGIIQGIDPIRLLEMCWPQVKIYDKQKETIYSVIQNDETIVPAGNKLGKDFISAYIALYFFLRCTPCRVITTSVDEGQLENVLWGEMKWFIQNSKVQLPLVVKHLEIKKLVNGIEDPKSYLIGRVAKKEEGLLGHHLARNELPYGGPATLMIYDEASGIENGFKDKTDTWAHRTLIIGNPFPCENFFKAGVKKGNIESTDGTRKFVNVIRIRAEDSPNVRYAQAQKKKKIKVTGENIVPGVLTYDEYEKRRLLWDKIRQCISLDAEFYEGAEFLLFPPDWLNRAEKIFKYHEMNTNIRFRKAEAIGIDPGEGVSPTCMYAVDHKGILKRFAQKTPDTSKIPGLIIDFARSVGLKPEDPDDAENILIDVGGGGKNHADHLREKGIEIRTIAFGGSASSSNKFERTKSYEDRIDEDESRQIYKNRRAEMYGIFSQLLCPDGKTEFEGFGISPEFTELRRQLAPFPKLLDKEGIMWLPPKYKRKLPGSNPSGVQQKTIEDLIGCSPDEADALVLAVFGMFDKPYLLEVGAL